MLGFGVKMNQIFASRWKAVIWSMGVLLTAYCAVPSPEETKEDKAQPAVAIPTFPAQPPGPGFDE